MNLLLFLNNDIHCATALAQLLPAISKYNLKIVLSQKVGKIENLAPELLELKKREQCEFNWQKKFGIEVLSYENVNKPQALTELRSFAPDLMVSIRFGQIFKDELISIPRLGILNLHSGILPKYRGVLASFWAILNGEKEIGTTLHFINNSGIDNGDVVGFYKSKIDFSSSLFSNIHNLYKPSCDLLGSNIEKILRGEKISTTSQKNLGQSNYFSYPKNDDVKKFLQVMKLV